MKAEVLKLCALAAALAALACSGGGDLPVVERSVAFGVESAHIEGSWRHSFRGLHEQPLLLHTGGNDAAFVPLPVRSGDYVVTVRLVVDGGGEHVELPKVLPRAELIEVTHEGGEYFDPPLVIGAGADDSVDVAAYDAVHEIVVPVDAALGDGQHYLRVQGEVGGGAIPEQLKVSGGSVDVAG